jgi:hypothetical protein
LVFPTKLLFRHLKGFDLLGEYPIYEMADLTDGAASHDRGEFEVGRLF